MAGSLGRSSIKLRNLKAAALLRRGGAIAHHTGTLPGVAAAPAARGGLAAMQRFKQRRGPFLLLADSVGTALALARWISPALRKAARSSWPGNVTLVFSARPGLPADCYRKGELALRVDADPATRQLARASGGLLLSSSLNRRGEASASPGLLHHLRHHRYLCGRISGRAGSGKASVIMRVRRNDCAIIRQ